MQIRSYKIKNPYRADQEIKQEVTISNDLVFDYTNSPWISVDTEYLSFNPLQDQLCTIQIASKENSDSNSIRCEIVYVFGTKPTEKLKNVFTNPTIEKIFHVFSCDIPRIENYLGIDIKGKLFDTKVASRIAWTNTQEHGMKSLIRMFVDPSFDQADCEKGLNDWEIGPENWTNEQVLYMIQDVLYLDVLKTRILEMAVRRGSYDLVLNTMEILHYISDLYKKGYNEKVLAY